MTTGPSRVGVLPVLRRHRAPGAVVLLHDAERPGEQEVMARWKRELGVAPVRSTEGERFALLAMPAVAVG